MFIQQKNLSITDVRKYKRLWSRGSYCASYFAANIKESYAWRLKCILAYLERDIRKLGCYVPPPRMWRLLGLLAHNNGNPLNCSNIGYSLEVSHHTVRCYVNVLATVGMIRILEPWFFEHVDKRQKKTPKIYIRDSGLLHALLGIRNDDELYVYPRLGASWEGFALEEIIKVNHGQPEECFFWGIQSGAELDLLIIKDGKRIGFEVKYTDVSSFAKASKDRPKLTRSMMTALQDLQLNHLYVVYSHKISYPLAENISVVGIEEIKAVF